MYCTYREEETIGENQVGQGFGHTLYATNGEDQQERDSIRQGVRAKLDARRVSDLEDLARITSASVIDEGPARRVDRL